MRMDEPSLEQQAFADLDQISTDAKQALDALARDDVEDAQDILTDIRNRADAWEDP